MATLTTLASFDSTDGTNPGGLIIDASGNLVGSTSSGGPNGGGTVFEIAKTPSGYASSPSVLVSFSTAQGSLGGLITDSSGNLFGTTTSGGTSGGGTVFEIAKTASGYASSPSVLANFDSTAGTSPGGLMFDASGNLLGTTSSGGANGDGTVFEIAKTTTGYASTATVLINFNAYTGYGYSFVPGGTFSVDASGDLFGVTSQQGYQFDGGVYEFAKTASGYASTPTLLVAFNAYNGAYPSSNLLVDASGNVFGTTLYGGASSDGVVYEISKTGSSGVLVSFNGTNGRYPQGGLTVDAAGNLFGTTSSGGANGSGTLFEIAKTASGYANTPTTVANFASTGTGGGLIADAAGDLFGITSTGGANGDGTVFEVADIGAPVVCYCTGTRILTASGEVAVEDLAIGDLVVTSSGEHRPIRWLGHRTLDCRTHVRPEEAHPVRIARHAFGENKPTQNLAVSRGHWICVDVLGEVLISVNDLINGTTITQVAVDHVTYWHIELESHDILMANGLPAESYRDMGNRKFFVENGIVGFDMVPDADLSDPSLRTDADICRPFIDGGPVLDAVRHQLRRRAESLGWMLDKSQPLADLHLVVDGRRIDPVVRGLTARFAMPAGARDVWLVSTTVRPIDLHHSDDARPLGVFLKGMTLYDGFGEPSVIAMDDPLLCVGFYGVEEGCRQWTTGRARLPAALWDRCTDEFFLRLDLEGPALPRWTKLPGLVADQSDQVKIPVRTGVWSSDRPRRQRGAPH